MAQWDLDRGIYPLATAVFRFNYMPLVAIALAQAALQSIPLAAGENAEFLTALGFLGASLLQVALLYVALLTPMTGDSVTRHPFPWPHLWAFFWRLLLLGIPAAVVLVGSLATGAPFLPILSLVVSLAVLGLFGTVLPDVVAGGAGRFDEAFERGRRSFGSFVGWMLLGPVLASLAVGIALGLFSSLLLATGIGTTGTGEAMALSPWFLGLFSLVGALGGAYVAALTAVVLAKAWAAGGGAIMRRR